MCGALFGMYLFLYTPYFTLVNAFPTLMVSMIIVILATTVFPYTRKSIFETSPANKKIGRLPMTTLVGAISIIYMIFMLFMFIIDPNALTTTTDTLIATFLTWAAAIVLYFTSKYMRRKKGIDIDLAFKEIPIE